MRFLFLAFCCGTVFAQVQPMAEWRGPLANGETNGVRLVRSDEGITLDWGATPLSAATLFVELQGADTTPGLHALAAFRGAFTEGGRRTEGLHPGVAIEGSGRVAGLWTDAVWAGQSVARAVCPFTGKGAFALCYAPAAGGTTLMRRLNGKWKTVYSSVALKASVEAVGSPNDGILGAAVGKSVWPDVKGGAPEVGRLAVFPCALTGGELDDWAYPVEAAARRKAVVSGDVPRRVLELPPGPGNPRNSEGDFIRLKDGRILLIYTRYNGDDAGDHAPAVLAQVESRDGGRTWSKTPRDIVRNVGGGKNVMSVSLLRLRNGDIALFYLRKNAWDDCFPVVRFSHDEGETWSEPTSCLPHTGKPGFCVLNNARAEMLSDGRILLPIARHAITERGPDMKGQIFCLYSDDQGRTWTKTEPEFKLFDAWGERVTLQEPGVVELKDGRVMMWIRTDRGRELACYSSDRGETWTRPVETDIYCPCAPVTIKRLRNGDLLMVWNDHRGHPELKPLHKYHAGTRSPLTLAVSSDDGLTWRKRKVLEGNIYEGGWYCYTAVLEEGDAVLLEYCAMKHLSHSRVTRVPLKWIYGPDPAGGPTTLVGHFDD